MDLEVYMRIDMPPKMQQGVLGSGNALVEDVGDGCLLGWHHLRLGVVHCQSEAHA